VTRRVTNLGGVVLRDAQKTRRSVRGASAIRRAGSDASARLEKALKEAEECVGECAAMWDDGTFWFFRVLVFFFCVYVGVSCSCARDVRRRARNRPGSTLTGCV